MSSIANKKLGAISVGSKILERGKPIYVHESEIDTRLLGLVKKGQVLIIKVSDHKRKLVML
tara:strand:- start:9104 stop:9286 length:183 start_codon:yes stop_codon:yes gene_type:complete